MLTFSQSKKHEDFPSSTMPNVLYKSYLVIKVKSVGFNILFLDDLFMLLKGETCRNYSSVLKEDLGQTNNNEFEVHITNWVKI